MAIQGPEIKITVDTSQAESQTKRFVSNLNSSMTKSSRLVSNQFTASMKQVGRVFGSAFTTIKRAASGLLTHLSILFGQRLSGVVFNTANDFKALQNVFGAFSSNSIEAGQQMEYLVSESSRLGFNIGELSDSYKKLFVAGRLTGFSSEKIQETFSSIAEAGAVAGMNTRQLEGALRAVYQMMSKGKVQAEELRGQLGEHLQGAFELAAKAMKVSTAELDKMLEQGKVTAKELLKNFPAELRKAYGPGLATALKLPRRELERLKNDLTLTMMAMSDGIIIVTNAFLRLMRAFTQNPSIDFIDSFEAAMINVATIIDSIPLMFKTAFEAAIIYIQPFVDALNSSMTSTGDSAGMMLDYLGEKLLAFGKLAAFVFMNLPNIVKSAFAQVQNAVTAILEAAHAFMVTNMTVIHNALKATGAAVNLLVESVKGAFLELGNIVAKSIDKMIAPIRELMRWGAEAADAMSKPEFADKLRSIADTNLGILQSSDDALAESKVKQKAYYQEITTGLQGVGEAYVTLFDDLKNVGSNFVDMNSLIQTGTTEEINAAMLQYEALFNTLNKGAKAFKEANQAQLEFGKTTKAVGQSSVQTAEAVETAWDKVSKKIEDSVANNLTNAFMDFVTGAKKGFKELVTEALESIAEIVFHELIAKELANSIVTSIKSVQTSGTGSSGGGLGDLLSGFGNWFGNLFKAEGGPVSKNSPYIVGEEGPELFVPGSSGNIVPNGRLPGGTASTATATMPGSSNVTVNVINNSSAETTVQETSSGNDRQINIMIENSVRDAIGAGRLDSAFGSAFGMRRRGFV